MSFVKSSNDISVTMTDCNNTALSEAIMQLQKDKGERFYTVLELDRVKLYETQ